MDVGGADQIIASLSVAAVAVVLGLIVLYFGFRFLLPFPFIRTSLKLLSETLGPLRLLMCAIWTIGLVPAPFLFFWSWFIRFGQALLIEAPQQIAIAAPTVASACPKSTTACISAISSVIFSFWNSALSGPARTMQVPPDFAMALLAFAAAITLAMLWRPEVNRTSVATVIGTSTGSFLILILSFAVSLYLSVTAILAIPVFSEKAPEMQPFIAQLSQDLASLTSKEVKFSGIDDLADERRKLAVSLGEGGSAPLSSSTPTEPAAQPNSIANIANSIWTSQLRDWDRRFEKLRSRSDEYVADSTNFQAVVISFFRVSDEGHINTEATKRHMAILTNSYSEWLRDYRDAFEECATSLRSDLGELHRFQENFRDFGNSSPVSNEDYSTRLGRALPRNYSEYCQIVKPNPRAYLAERSGLADSLGLFGAASAWLLKTESQELALIVGLLGFGFFGSLATSFIREFRGTDGNQLPNVGFIIPALIRGIGAAVLVFLLAKGGSAIFTKGDSTPNAYAIFFACFVAAAYSDDVWRWVQNWQRNQFGDGSQIQKASTQVAAGSAQTSSGGQI